MEADEEHDHDLTFGGDRDSLASSSTSLASAITKYRFIKNRRYHSYEADKYSFPNDEDEVNRLDIEHHNQLLQSNGKLHICPLENPKEILDLGTGSGVWAIEMADLYPECQVIGTDLSPIQPTWVPSNCRFEIDDFEQEWSANALVAVLIFEADECRTWGENRFDMIYERFCMGSITDYPKLYDRVFKALKPGGYFEIVEMETGIYCDDDTLSKDSPTAQFSDFIDEAFKVIGRPLPRIDQYQGLLKGAGFEKIQVDVRKRPNNDWPKDPRMKEIGLFCCLNLLEGLEGYSLYPFTRGLGWTEEEVHAFNVKVREEFLDRKTHGYQKGIVAYAQKPVT